MTNLQLLNQIIQKVKEIKNEENFCYNIEKYLKDLQEKEMAKVNNTPLAPKSYKVLLFLNNNEQNGEMTSVIIAEGVMVTPRSVSGSIRSLVEKGLVSSISKGATKYYKITEEGKNYLNK